MTQGEYNSLARWLAARSLRPADLLTDRSVLGQPELLEAGVAPERLHRLLGQGVALAIELDRWTQRGLWVLGRGDEGYPPRLRNALRHLAPPLLFGVGQRGLLHKEAVCIVGSRDASLGALEFTRRLAESCAEANLAVVSGGARGIDQEAMNGALDRGGTVVGVIAEGLAKVVTRALRERLMDGRLCLVSPFSPDARWTPARAMERNKVIYGLSIAAIIAESDVSGGTWTGAQENLRHRWVPAGVRAAPDTPIGNLKLQAAGLLPLRDMDVASGRALRQWLETATAAAAEGSRDLLSPPPPSAVPPQRSDDCADAPTPAADLFGLFLRLLPPLLREGPLNAAEIADRLALEPAQAKAWLKRAEGEGTVSLGGKPKKYRLPSHTLL